MLFLIIMQKCIYEKRSTCEKIMTSISLVLITKNEERCLDRCLSSFLSFVDEVVVLDTGSSDGTVDIAKKYNAIIKQTEWNNDFSEARNISLGLVRTDYCFVVDADEWLISGGEYIKERVEWNYPCGFRVKRRNYFNLQGEQESMEEWITRIFPKDTKYQGFIHEQPFFSGATSKLEILIGHDGYLSKYRQGKESRNIQLLLKIIEEKPNDEYYNYQLGKEYENQSNFVNASKYYSTAIRFTSTSAPYRHDLVVRSIFSFGKAGLFDLCEMLISSGEWSDSPDFHFAAGGALLDYAIIDSSKALSLMPRIEAHWLRCLEIGDGTFSHTTVKGRGSFLAAKNLAALYGVMGRKNEEKKYKDLESAMRRGR